MLGLCFVLQYFVPFLVLQSTGWERESWLLYICCSLTVMSLLSFLNFFLFFSGFFVFCHGAMGCTVVCDCGISCSYSLFYAAGSKY